MPNFVHTKVDPEALSKVAKSVELDLDMVDSALRTVREAIMGKLRPTWSGPASDEFYKMYEGSSVSIDILVKLMRDYNQRLGRAAGVYDAADSEANDEVTSLSIE